MRKSEIGWLIPFFAAWIWLCVTLLVLANMGYI